MATEVAHAGAHAEHDAHEHAEHSEHAHPSDLKYIWIALTLGVLTAIEVATYFFDFKSALVPALVVLMVAKFALVILYFMHLKFDNPLFMKLFISGLILAVAVYMVMLSAFEFFAD